VIEPRFYASTLDATAPDLRLDGDEGRHLSRVLRLAPGAIVRVFDGRGLEVRATVASVDKSGARLEIIGPVAAAPEPPVAITVVQAVLKGDGMDAVVRDATMMGVAAIAPVLTARTVVTTKAMGPDGASAVARWRRVAVASAKQCGRARVPHIEAPRVLGALLREGRGEGARLMLVEPSASRDGAPSALPEAPQSARLLVGPEGGWTPEEIADAMAAGWTAWSLGALTLRADAAALAALGALVFAWRADPAAR
jgi:16S rRNA (uracil1498-N3)-methyltransferase